MSTDYSRFFPPFCSLLGRSQSLTRDSTPPAKNIPRSGYRRSKSHPKPRVPGHCWLSNVNFVPAKVPALPGLGGPGIYIDWCINFENVCFPMVIWYSNIIFPMLSCLLDLTNLQNFLGRSEQGVSIKLLIIIVIICHIKFFLINLTGVPILCSITYRFWVLINIL